MGLTQNIQDIEDFMRSILVGVQFACLSVGLEPSSHDYIEVDVLLRKDQAGRVLATILMADGYHVVAARLVNIDHPRWSRTVLQMEKA